MAWPEKTFPKPAQDAGDAEDAACLRAVAGRDRPSFEALYRRHHPRLARFLRRFTARHDVIDDVVNDTMWVVWSKAAEFRGESKVSTWITGIAYRCMLKALRQLPPPEEVSEAVCDGGALHAGTVSVQEEQDRELHDWVARGLRTLPEDQRITLELAYFLGHSCEEIAAMMGCPVGTVKARMFHARVRLRNVMPALGGLADSAQG